MTIQPQHSAALNRQGNVVQHSLSGTHTSKIGDHRQYHADKKKSPQRDMVRRLVQSADIEHTGIIHHNTRLFFSMTVIVRLSQIHMIGQSEFQMKVNHSDLGEMTHITK